MTKGKVMKTKTQEVMEGFKTVLLNAIDVENEFTRLADIEIRLLKCLETAKSEVTGLEKARNLSSISYDARDVIEKSMKSKKEYANKLASLLGISEIYQIEKSR
jgi:hypothetical protein